MKEKIFWRFGPLIWTALATLVIGFTIFLNLKIIHIDEDRYLTDFKYAAAIRRASEYGTVLFKGNTTIIKNPLILFILAVGLVLSLYLFLIYRKLGYKTILPLFMIIGILIPVLPPYNGNTLVRFAICFIICLFTSLILQNTMRPLTQRCAEEKR